MVALASDARMEALKVHVKATLARYKYSRWVEIVAELPKTVTGKIRCFKGLHIRPGECFGWEAKHPVRVLSCERT